MTTNEDQTTGQLPSKISRRTLAAGAAWSVPVIAVASAAPAYAVSGQDCLQFTLAAESCKLPGAGNNWGYKFNFCIKNTCPDGELTVLITYLQNNSKKEFTPLTPPGQPAGGYVIPAGDTVCTGLATYNTTSSANEVWIDGTINGGPTVRLAELPSPPNNCPVV